MKKNYLLALALALGLLPSLRAQDPSRGEYRIPVKKLDIQKYTALAQISVAPDGTWVAVDPQGNVYNGTTNAWQKLPGNLNQVSAGSQNEIWGVNFDHAVFRFNNTLGNWDTIAGPGSLQQVVVARGGGLVMGIQWAAPKKVVRWDAATRQWIPLDGAPAIVQLALGSTNHVFGITAAGELYKLMLPSWNTWKKLKGSFKHISVGEDGTLGCVGADGVVRRRTNEDVNKEVTDPNVTPTFDTPDAPAATIEVVNKDQSHMIDPTGATSELLPIDAPVVVQPVQLTFPAINKTITIEKPSIINSNLVLIDQLLVVKGEVSLTTQPPPAPSSNTANVTTQNCIQVSPDTALDLSLTQSTTIRCSDVKTAQVVEYKDAKTCPAGTVQAYEQSLFSFRCALGKFSKVKINPCTPSSSLANYKAVLGTNQKGGCAGQGSAAVETREAPQKSIMAGSDCAPRSFLSRSAHSSVQWDLPNAKSGSLMTVKAGAHNNYVFPACNRVVWSDLIFSCQPTGSSVIPYQWRLIFGKYDADAYCTGAPGNNFYQSISDKGINDK